MHDFSRRMIATELMDDLSRPPEEFDHAFRELKTINRRLGGIRAVERFLPSGSGFTLLDVAAGGCDVGDALVERRSCRAVSLDINALGLRRSRLTAPVVGDGRALPFPDRAFDAVICSLSFHHLADNECVEVLREMWRVTRGCAIVNDLHRTRVAYTSIVLLSRFFSTSVMVKHDGPVSVLRAFRPEELREIGRRAGVPGGVHRSFPYRLVLVANR
jgi:ubiquinone/menaquinone biosynthesis C-methylase UbiE